MAYTIEIPSVSTSVDRGLSFGLLDHFSIAGYSWFWYGDAVDDTVLSRDDAEQFYLMVTLGF